MSTARPEIPYPCVYKAKWQVNTYLRGRLCDHIVSLVLYILTYNMYYVDYATSNITIRDRSKGSMYN